MSKKIKDVEFAVHDRIFKTFDEAAGFAVGIAQSSGSDVHIDVLIHSKAGARAWGGGDAVEEYESDPDASVSDRITIKAERIGRVY